MRSKEHSWPEVWAEVQRMLELHAAPTAVKEAASPDKVGWNYVNGKFYLFCPKALYEWIEIADPITMESNLGLIKPLLWPIMQKHHCDILIYRLTDNGR